MLTDSQASKYDEIKAPISSSLLVPCRVAYPLRDLSLESDLEGFYETLLHNLGEVEKCYNKDEELIEEVKSR